MCSREKLDEFERTNVYTNDYGAGSVDGFGVGLCGISFDGSGNATGWGDSCMDGYGYGAEKTPNWHYGYGRGSGIGSRNMSGHGGFNTGYHPVNG